MQTVIIPCACTMKKRLNPLAPAYPIQSNPNPNPNPDPDPNPNATRVLIPSRSWPFPPVGSSVWAKPSVSESASRSPLGAVLDLTEITKRKKQEGKKKVQLETHVRNGRQFHRWSLLLFPIPPPFPVSLTQSYTQSGCARNPSQFPGPLW